ncbi:hypothetical protein BDN71DRAFT_1509016 [Pleurotus eryngii]|uniref:Uncharacterized protein n=1 Tax=Pleurotus eryngii TaxID=5323 RepID=A0A9P5ZSH4_PLEER|nr:hypothetical protein BDN71DRAFT_1509016 [Pleurotus eryngii]
MKSMSLSDGCQIYPVEMVEPSCSRQPDNHEICFYFSMENLLPKASTPSTPTPATPTPIIPTPVIPTPAIPTPIIPTHVILNPNSLWNPTHIPPDVSKTTLSQAAHRGYLHESDITLIRGPTQSFLDFAIKYCPASCCLLAFFESHVTDLGKDLSTQPSLASSAKTRLALKEWGRNQRKAMKEANEDEDHHHHHHPEEQEQEQEELEDD